MQTLEKKNHKKAKIIVFLLMFVSFALAVLFGYLYVLSFKKIALIKYPKYTLSETNWTSQNIIITIEASDKIEAYSFDNGENFQEDNTYEVLENGEFKLVVRDINGNLSNSVFVKIDRIDKEPPQISFENNTVVQLNKNFSLRNGVNVTDGKGSGLSSNYSVTPDKIDTSVEGTYTVIYTAFDKVGNYTEKERTIVVSDVQGRTYYRYRTSTTETHDCEPYTCNCESTTTNSCPTIYQFVEPNKCCKTCYKSCKETVWSEWSEWSQEKVTPNSTTEVETKIE